MLTRRDLALALAASFAATTAFADDPVREVVVMKTPTCGCCNAWIDHLEEHGFRVEAKNMSQGALNEAKRRIGIDPRHASCHTGTIDGYAIEGHVPAADIARLLDTRPEALGLSVPRMPIGSPGMEMGDERDAFDVLLIQRDGGAEVFSSYDAR